MSAIESTKAYLDDFFRKHGDINAENYKELGRILNRRNAIELLTEVRGDSSLLAAVAQRSHRHSQGFGKVVLVDDRENSGYKLRSHGWTKDVKEGASPLTEDKHEHRWNFASAAFGTIENQRYVLRELDPPEKVAWDKFEAAMQGKSLADVAAICTRLDQLEMIEMAHTLSRMPKLMGGVDARDNLSDRRGLKRELGLNDDELNAIVHILFKYSNKRNPETQQEAYAPAGPRVFELKDVEIYKPDTLYFHPIELAHRLFIDTIRESVCTLLVTGPVHKGKKPGEFVRSTVGRENKAVRPRQSYTPDELGGILDEWIDHLKTPI